MRKADKLFAIFLVILLITLPIIYNSLQKKHDLEKLNDYSKIIATELWHLNDKVLHDYISVIGILEGYTYVEVFDEDNKIIATFKNKNDRHLSIANINCTFLRTYEKQVAFNNQTIGHISITKCYNNLFIFISIFFVLLLAGAIFRSLSYLYYKLKDDEERILVSYEQTAVAMIMLTKDQFFDCNKAALNLFGFLSKEDFLITPFSKILCDPLILFQDKIKKALECGQTNFQFKFKTTSGKCLPTKVTFSSFIYNNNKVIHSTINDISDEIKNTKEKENMQKQVMQTSKLASIGELAAGVGHEINNPLAIVVGNVMRIKKELQNLSIDNKIINTAISRQEDANKRIANIVDGLRTYSRMDTETREVLNIHQIISKTQKLVANMYKKEGIEIYLHLQATTYYAVGNTSKFQQVLMNLITNARDAMKNCKQSKITISTKNNADQILINITDTGAGIPKELEDKIFETFFTTKDIGEGTGMGLGISYSIIKEMEGSIKVDSQLGIGSKFKIILPAISNMQDEQQASSPKPFNNINGTALVIDDEEGIRELITDFLESIGLTVEEADDGDTALEKVKQKKYDYIITDIKMPRMCGNKFIEEAKKLPSGDTIYILITGDMSSNLFNEQKQLHQHNIDGILLKPFSNEDIYTELVKAKKSYTDNCK